MFKIQLLHRGNKDKLKTKNNSGVILEFQFHKNSGVLAALCIFKFLNLKKSKWFYILQFFSISICAVGMLWLLIFHIDLFRYKQKVLRKMMGTTEQIDVSTSTDFNFGITFLGNETPPYRFLTGRHSGSFYLKTGLAGIYYSFIKYLFA